MGKPYLAEMDKLSQVYAWAVKDDVSALAASVHASLNGPLIAIGSGGSFSAASLLARLHDEHTGNVSKAVTPLISSQLPRNHSGLTLWLLSAQGKNKDILRSLEHCVEIEPSGLYVLTNASPSPLAELARRAGRRSFEFPLPIGRDGYLATNSLVATALIFMRAYAMVSGSEISIPDTFSGWGIKNVQGTIASYASDLSAIWERHDLIVLHGPSNDVGAIDLESKFVEAALASVLRADYRDFAHGRHHWLTKFPASSAVIAFVSPADREIARSTLKQLPANIPTAVIDLQHAGINGQVESLLHTFLLTAAAGIAANVDPGRPGVATFGSRLYNLGLSTLQPRERTRLRKIEGSIERKSRMTIPFLRRANQLDFWIGKYEHFAHVLERARFGSLVVDLDGTLVDTDQRFSPLTESVADVLNELLDTGLVIGIATGRGGSARELLISSIQPKFYERVLIGYYNGAIVRALAEPEPTPDSNIVASLKQARDLLSTIALDMEIECRPRRFQITLKPKGDGPGLGGDQLWRLVEQTLQVAGLSRVRVVRSTHSIDVLAPNVSKLSVVEKVRQLKPDAETLRIGDMGEWPGNDFELLGHEYGLSVGEVSRTPSQCWNLLPLGFRGTKGFVAYARALRIDCSGMASLRVEDIA